MYIETSSPRVNGDLAIIQKAGLTFNGNMCLEFYYHMYGSAMGKLEVSVGSRTVFSKSGDQGNKWIKADLRLADKGVQSVSPYRVLMRACDHFNNDVIHGKALKSVSLFLTNSPR